MDHPHEPDRLTAENRSLRRTVSMQASRLESSIKIMSTLYSLSTVPIKTAGPAEAGTAILETLIREFDEIATCSLLLYEPEHDHLRLLAARGQDDLFGEPERPRNKDLTFKPGEGVAGKAFADNQSIFWDAESGDDEILKRDQGLTTPHSLASLTLSPLDRRLGVLNLSFEKIRPFDLPRRRDLILLSGVVANMIHTLMLRNDVSEHADSLADKVQALEREIAERKRAEQALLESEVRYRLVTDAVHDVIWSIDLATMHFTYLSPSVERQTGYRVDEALNWRLEDVLTPASQQKIQDLLALELAADEVEGANPNRTYEVEYQQIKKSGELFWVGDTITAVRDSQGQPRGLVGVSRDLTERKRLERQLQQAHKMEAVGTLAGGVAHDFNNILQAMMGYTALIANSNELGSECAGWLDKVSWGAEKAADLVQRLLTFSRKVEPQLSALDLNEEVMESVELLQRILPKMVAIETRLADGLPVVGGDANQIEQIILNLATNARDAMPDGGRLIFETRQTKLDDEFCSKHLGSRSGDYVVLKVSDTGTGVLDEVMPHIFEPFYTTKGVGQGTGLGLAMIYGIVKNHQGYITCQSQRGQGTSFAVYLPLLQGTIAPRVPPVEDKPLVGGNETILLVDDEQSLLELSGDGLRKWGYNVLTAETGEQALEIVGQKGDKPDLVVLDLGMPGMGGHACLKEMVKIQPDIRVIVSTGYSPRSLAKQSLELGVHGFLGKPYHLSALLSKVREVLDTAS